MGIAFALLLPTAKLQRIGAIDTGTSFDIPIFRCAARILGNGDPYTIEPLATCEREQPKIFMGLIAPAPQPPYVLALFKPFSWLSEERFAAGWLSVNVAVALLAAGFLSRLCGFSAAAIFLALTWGPGFDVLSLGQLSMVEVLGVSWAAYELRRGRPRTAACALCLAMMVPHVGVPAFLALFVLVPRARLTIVALVFAGLAATIAIGGPQICWEYVSRVLPLQALGEATNPEQYSLTIAAVMAGVPDVVALRLGEFQYVLFAVVSIALGQRLRARFDDQAFVVALPAAFAVLGGPYIHYSDMIAMWPAVLLLATYARGKQRNAAVVLVAVLASPWRTEPWLKLEIVIAISEAIIVWAFLAGMPRPHRFIAFATILVPLVLAHSVIPRATGAFGFVRPAARVFVALPPARPLALEAPWGVTLAPMPWGTYIRQRGTFVSQREAYAKLGSIVADLLFLALAVRAGYARQGGLGRLLDVGLAAGAARVSPARTVPGRSRF